MYSSTSTCYKGNYASKGLLQMFATVLRRSRSDPGVWTHNSHRCCPTGYGAFMSAIDDTTRVIRGCDSCGRCWPVNWRRSWRNITSKATSSRKSSASFSTRLAAFVSHGLRQYYDVNQTTSVTLLQSDCMYAKRDFHMEILSVRPSVRSSNMWIATKRNNRLSMCQTVQQNDVSLRQILWYRWYRWRGGAIGKTSDMRFISRGFESCLGTIA